MIPIYIVASVLLLVIGFLIGCVWVARRLHVLLARMTAEQLGDLADKVAKERRD